MADGMTSSELRQLAEMAATATHTLRESYERFGSELRELEAAFRLLRDVDEQNALIRLQTAFSRLIELVGRQQNSLAGALAVLKATLDALQRG